MAGTLFLATSPFASFSDFTQTVIPANGQVDLSVTVNIDLLDLAGNIQNLITGQASELNFNVVGNVNVTGLVLPFNLTQTVNVP